MANVPQHLTPGREEEEETVSSLRELYRVIDRLYRVEGKSDSVREEIVHDTVVRTWMSWSKMLGGSLLPPTNIRPPISVAYARKTLRNTYVDHLRRGFALENIDEAPTPSFVESEPGFVLAEFARSILGKLTKKDRVMLKLRYARGRSFEDIARILGTTPASARSMLSRARYRAMRQSKLDEG